MARRSLPLSKVYGQRDALSAEPGDLLGPHLQNFIDSVRTRRQPACDLSIGMTSSACAMAALEQGNGTGAGSIPGDVL